MIHEAFRFMMVKTTCLQQCLDSWHFHVLVLLIPNIVKHFVHVCCVHSTFVFQIHLRHGARLGSAARLVAGENIDIQHAVNAS